MRRPSIPLHLALAGLLGSSSLVAAAGTKEAPPADAQAPAPASVHTLGGSSTGGGAIRVELRDVPTGDPEAVAGELRGHEQGDARDVAQPDNDIDTDSDRPATEGPGPGEAERRGPDAPSALGDLRRNFVGQTASGWLPPDPVLAVGQRHVVEVVNSGFTIFTKDGGLERAYTDLEGFFGPSLFPILPIPCTNANCFVFDPRIIYSHWHGQFVMQALVRDDVNLRSYIFFAISATGDPLGGWYLYFTYDPFNTDTWVDYSGLGADDLGVYFTGNEFFFAGGFKHSIILSVRPDVFNGTWNGAWIFYGLTWPTVGNPLVFEIQPASPTHGFAGDGATWFVNTQNFSGNLACLWELTGDRGSSPSLIRDAVTVQAYADPGMAEQPDAAADDIEMFYAGAQNAVYSQRHVYFALNDDNAGSADFYVSKLNVDTNTEARNITYHTTGIYYYYPNVTLFGSDSFDPLLALGMSWSGNAQYPSGALKLYQDFTVDASGNFINVAGGSSTYNVYFNGRNRWGDYMGVARDHTCDTAWSVTQYAPSFNVWRTMISEIEGDVPPTGVCNLIFDDSFERGSTANWSSATP